MGIRNRGAIARLRLTHPRACSGLVVAGLAWAWMAPMAGELALGQNGAYAPPAVDRLAGSARPSHLLARQEKEKKNSQANIERRKQIAEDSEVLLKLATDLKTEVDKSNKDTLSLTVIHKAEAIEKLARSVKEKMKLTVGAS